MKNNIECKYKNPPFTTRHNCLCQSCKNSIKGQNKSSLVYANHVFGKFCKLSNICSLCATTKLYIRRIKHFSSNVCSRKCDMCPSNVGKKFNEHCKWSIAKRIYALMLGSRPLRRQKELMKMMITK